MIFEDYHYKPLLKYHATFQNAETVNKNIKQYINNLQNDDAKESALNCSKEIEECKNKIIQEIKGIKKDNENEIIRRIIKICFLHLMEREADYATVVIDLLKQSKYSTKLNIDKIVEYDSFWSGNSVFYFISYNLEHGEEIEKEIVNKICGGLNFQKTDIDKVLKKKNYIAEIIKIYLDKKFNRNYHILGSSSKTYKNDEIISPKMNNFILFVGDKCLSEIGQNTSKEFRHYYRIKRVNLEYVGKHKTLLFSNISPLYDNKAWYDIVKKDAIICLKDDKDFSKNFVESIKNIESWIIESYNEFIEGFLKEPSQENKKNMTLCEQIREAIEGNDFLDALELFKQKGVNGTEILRLKTKWVGIDKAFRKTEITREAYNTEKTHFTNELIDLYNMLCQEENSKNQQSNQKQKFFNMNHNNERIEAINESLDRCVNKYKLHLIDFEAESEARAYDGKEGMKKFNSKISELEYELLSFTSGIPEDEKEILIEEMKESRNPDKSIKERSTAKQKAIDLLKKYGPRVLEIGGAVALTLILRSLGLSLADIGLGE